MKLLFVLNDPPYGTERACAKAGQKVPNGYYSLERMAGGLTRHGAQIAVCGTCMDARGIAEDEVIAGTARGTLEQLADWTEWSDKVIVF